MNILKNFSFKYKWGRYIWQIIIFWTLVIFVSSFWNISNIYKTTIHDLKLQATVAFDKDIQYRSWNAKHGGVYVPVSNYGKPNPYLKGLVKRDIIDQVGDTLTMINPAYMTRQVHESELSNIGVKGHITSLNLIRPENAADEWETTALQAFNEGLNEISIIEMLDNIKYFRFMKPLFIEKSCLKCHEKQGYKIGDIRGGISISIPIESMLQKTYANMRNHGLIEGLIWIIGLVGIVLGYMSVKKAGVELTKHRDSLETRVKERTVELKERIKELRFLYNTTKIARRPGITLDETYRESVKQIPPGWQYPEITGGCITIDGKAYKTKNFKETKWMQRENIQVSEKIIGTVEVCYLQEKPDEDEGPFLKEERELIMNFAKQLGEHIMRMKAESMQRQYKHIVSSSTDMMALLDKQFKYLSANEAYTKAFKLTSEKLIGQTVTEVFGKEFFNTVIKPSANRCLKGEIINFQGWFDFPAYKNRYMDIYYYPYYSKDNKIMGFVVNGRNITEHKQAEEELKKHREHLEELVKERTQELESFSYSVSHDLRAPLRAIDGFTRILIENYASKLDKEGRRLGSTIHENAKKMGRLIDDLLTFSRLGRASMTSTKIDLKSMVKSV